MPTVLFKISVCKSACKKIYNVICIGDDSGSSESLPQPNNAAYKPVVINISNDAGPSHRRMKAKKKKKKEHTSHAPTTKSINPQDLHNPRGNKVRLYRKQLTNLRRLIATRKPHIRYYICHMSKTFATQRMYFSASFTKKYLRRCIDPKLYDLPIKSGDGNTCIKARLIKGVDNRATITRGWANFFHAANMKEREIYAFAFKRNYKRLRLTVHAL